jgi:hypothetical protein
MGLWDRIRGQAPVVEAARPAEAPSAVEALGALRHELSVAYDNLQLFEERIAELELGAEEIFWQRLDSEGPGEFSREMLRKLTRLSRIYYLKNPLVRRAVALQAYYVFGQGVSITARAPQVNDVVQAFLDDPANKAELTSHQARVGKETRLQIEGNLFFVFFTDKTTGRVRIRTLPFEEVADILTNPDDAKEPRYYKRAYTQRVLNLQTGRETYKPTTAYYPDWQYRPPAGERVAAIGNAPVHWDTPVYHIKVGGLDDMRFGVPETYAALDWATAYKKFLENWATIVDSLSRFAWKLSPKGGARGVAAAKAKLGSTFGTAGGAEQNPPPVTGAVALVPEGADLTPIPKTGATVAADDGRRLLLMVAAAVGLPETFFGDASVGNHATSKTLDRPTELKFLDRRTLWADVFGDLLSFVVDQAALASGGPLQAPTRTIGDQLQLADDPATGQPVDRGIDVDFPPILEHDVLASVQSVVAAATLEGHPPAGVLDLKLIARLLLQALGVADIDEILDTLFPEDEGPAADVAGPADPPPGLDPQLAPGSVGNPTVGTP